MEMTKERALADIDARTATLTISFDDVVARLRREGEMIRRGHNYYVGQVITPRPQFGYEGVGLPHVIVETKRLERNRNGWSTAAYGKMADLLVARVLDDGKTVSFWVEGYAYEMWDSEKHGAGYDARRAAAIAKIEAMKKEIAATFDPPPAAPPAPEPTIVDGPKPAPIGDEPVTLPEIVANGDMPAPVEDKAPVLDVIADNAGITTPVYDGEQPGPSPTPGPADSDKPGETVAEVVDPAGPAAPLTAPPPGADNHENPFKGDAA